MEEEWGEEEEVVPLPNIRVHIIINRIPPPQAPLRVNTDTRGDISITMVNKREGRSKGQCRGAEVWAMGIILKIQRNKKIIIINKEEKI